MKQRALFSTQSLLMGMGFLSLGFLALFVFTQACWASDLPANYFDSHHPCRIPPPYVERPHGRVYIKTFTPVEEQAKLLILDLTNLNAAIRLQGVRPSLSNPKEKLPLTIKTRITYVDHKFIVRLYPNPPEWIPQGNGVYKLLMFPHPNINPNVSLTITAPNDMLCEVRAKTGWIVAKDMDVPPIVSSSAIKILDKEPVPVSISHPKPTPEAMSLPNSNNFTQKGVGWTPLSIRRFNSLSQRLNPRSPRVTQNHPYGKLPRYRRNRPILESRP